MQKERIESLLADNHRLMSTITKLKCDLSQTRIEKESLCKNIRMLNIGIDSLEEILSKGKAAGDSSGLG